MNEKNPGSRVRIRKPRYPERIQYNPALMALYRKAHYYDQNVLLFWLGGTGTRKSGSAIEWALELDHTFNLNRCVFKASEFMELIEKGEVVTKPNGDIVYKKLKRGSVVIWDETGIEADNTEWNTAKAKLIKWTFTMIRYLNLIVFLTTTHLTTVQLGVRRLIHAAVEMQGIPSDSGHFPIGKYAQGKFFWLYYDSFTGKPYRKELRYVNADGEYAIANPVMVHRPPKEIEEAYKVKKDFYAQNWFSFYAKEMDYINAKVGEKQLEKKESYDALEDKVIASWWEFFAAGRKRFSADLIRLKFNIKPNRARDLALKLNQNLSNGSLNLLPHEVPI
jgi:hypothetical protein